MIIHAKLPSLDAIKLLVPHADKLNQLSKEPESLGVNVSISAAITAHARIQINKYKYIIHDMGASYLLSFLNTFNGPASVFFLLQLLCLLTPFTY
jgi:hypothetical protein